MPRSCSRSPSAGVASWLLAPPATTAALSVGIGRFGEDRAERVGADDVGLEEQHLVRLDDRAADGVGERLGLLGIDVGDRQPRAFGVGVHRQPAGDAAGALDGDVQPVDGVLAERALHRRLEAEEHAERGMRAGIAADFARAFRRKPGDEAGLAAHLDHVGDAHADVLGGDVAAAEPVDGAAERGQQVGRLVLALIGEDHRLAAAQRQPGHGVLEAHAPRQPQRVGQRVGLVGIMPEARAARGRPEMRRMDGDDRPKPAFGPVDEVQAFVRVEIGEAPGHVHVFGKSRLLVRRMGRPTGLEPATPGTTNRCSNQLSYDRHRARRIPSGRTVPSGAAAP